MQSTARSISALINTLIELCKDREEGFRTAAREVQSPMLGTLFIDLSLERIRYGNELQAIVKSLEEVPESHGSFSAAVDRGWMGLKSVMGKTSDFSILEECERSEQIAITAYRETLDHEELPPHIRSVIQRQYFTMEGNHDRLRDLRDSYRAPGDGGAERPSHDAIS